MRRKRRTKYTWFPVNGRSDVIDLIGTYPGAAFRLLPGNTNQNAVDPNNQTTLYFPICPDFTAEQGAGALTSNNQLRDIVEGQAWLLKRLVGKIHLSVTALASPTNFATEWQQLLVTAGFFVARAFDEAPAQLDLNVQEYDPQQKDNVMNPWIWRRTWLLRNPGDSNAAGQGLGINYPTSTMEMGNIAEGGHIDSKVSRRITREHRLWFVLQVMGGDPNRLSVTGSSTVQPQVRGFLDVRVLGAMRRNKNVSSF